MNPDTQLDGLLMVNKTGGMTSHDVVDFVRKRFRIKKAGHCGTLDPMATGLLMILMGKATKMQDLLMAEDKEYRGTLLLGVSTDTQDAMGQPLETKPVPDYTADDLAAAFAQFQGDFYQVPPMVSALKKDGVPLYKLARQGKVVEREPRLVTVYRHSILAINLPRVEFEIRCSKGFYVRTYCHDIGQKLGCGGHLAALCRTRSGNFDLSQAITWEKLQALESIEELRPYVLTQPEISRIRRQ
jgi:tRNA pseudouridine55 synthase